MTDRRFVLSCHFGFKFNLQLLDCSLAHIPATIEINDRVSKNLVEPSQDIFIVAKLVCRFHCFEKAVLDDIRSKIGVGDSAPDETDEGIQIFDQSLLKIVQSKNKVDGFFRFVQIQLFSEEV